MQCPASPASPTLSILIGHPCPVVMCTWRIVPMLLMLHEVYSYFHLLHYRIYMTLVFFGIWTRRDRKTV